MLASPRREGSGSADWPPGHATPRLASDQRTPSLDRGVMSDAQMSASMLPTVLVVDGLGFGSGGDGGRGADGKAATREG